jgi:hypothetical protein
VLSLYLRFAAIAGVAGVGCRPPRAPAVVPIAAVTGEPEMAEGFAQWTSQWSYEDYVTAASDDDAVVLRRSTTLSQKATYGVGLRLDGRRPSWAIDATPGGPVFAYDENGNGTIDDDPVRPLALSGTTWEITIPKPGRAGQPMFRVRIHDGRRQLLTFEPVSVRWGRIAIDGAPIEFGVFGVFGVYLGDIAFDADGDSQVELQKRTEYTPRGRMIELRGACYRAAVEPTGARVELTRYSRGLGSKCLDPDDAI